MERLLHCLMIWFSFFFGKAGVRSKKKVMLFRFLVLGALLTLGINTKVSAQSFPVQVIPQAIPPAPIYFTNYADASTVNGPLRVQVVLNDFTITNREVRLKAYFQGNGITFQSNDIVVGAPTLFLEGGIPLTLTNVELAPYFRFENITGISPNVYGQAIPEGAYQFCFEIIDVLSGNRLSQKSCATTVIFQNEPPFLVSPYNKTNIEERNPQNIVFQWTPRQINVSNVEYELSIVEIWDTYVDPQAAFLSSPPIFQTTTAATTYVYGPSDPLFLSNKNYAWRVQAKAKQGTEEIGLFKNQGYSEIYSFSYAGVCSLPSAINHEVKGSTNANIFWDDFSTDVPEYTVRYRKKGNENEWFLNKTTSNTTTLWDLKAGTVYEYQVQKKCVVTQSDWSTVRQFTTFIADDEASVYECGITPDFSLTNTEPLPSITVGEQFTAGDFPIKILEVSGSDGRFTGKGYVTIPYLNSIRVGVEFTNVLINTDKQMAEGTVITMYDPTLSNIIDVDAAIDTVTNVVEALGEPFEGDNDLDEIRINWVLDPENDIKIEDGILVITNPQNGATETSPLGDDKVIVDGAGNVYHVDAGGNITEGGQLDPSGSVTTGNVTGVSQDGELRALTAKGIMVTFEDNGVYGYDQMPITNSEKLKKEYVTIPDADGNPYTLVHQAVAKGDSIEVKAKVVISNSDYTIEDIIFKSKSGEIIPSENSDGDLILTLKGRYTLENETIYAVVPSKTEEDQQLTAGAFTLWHLTDRQIEVVLVAVDGVSIPPTTIDAVKDIFNKGVATLNISTQSASLSENILGGDNALEIGDSPWLSNYNAEQKAVIEDLKSKISYNPNTYYLFVFDSEVKTTKSIGGFMPLQRQFGFVFNGDLTAVEEGKDDLATTIAHELGHGIFALQHPFTQYGSSDGATDWLMDYKDGASLLPHMHWAQMHNPALKFYVFQDEEDGALIQNSITDYLNINNKGWDKYAFLSPIGSTIILEEATDLKFNEDGAVIAFRIGKNRYLGTYSEATQKFLGYINSSHSFIKESQILTDELTKEFNQKKYNNVKFAPIGYPVLAIAKRRFNRAYLDCIIQATWNNEIQHTSFTGISNPPFIPDNAIKIDLYGSKCFDGDLEGLIDGVGINIFYALMNEVTESERQNLVDFSNYMSEYLKDKTFTFYGNELEEEREFNKFGSQILTYLKQNKIYSLEIFQSSEHFPFESYSRDVQVVFSNINLRRDIIELDYNKNSIDYTGLNPKYEYSLSDLEVRYSYLYNGNVSTGIANLIRRSESQGNAQAISQKDGYDQYLAIFGTDSALYFMAYWSAQYAQDLLPAYFLRALIAEYGALVSIQFIKEKGKEALKAAAFDAALQLFTNYYFNNETQFSFDKSIDKISKLSLLSSVAKSLATLGYKQEVFLDCLEGGFLDTDDDKLQIQFNAYDCVRSAVVGLILKKSLYQATSFVTTVANAAKDDPSIFIKGMKILLNDIGEEQSKVFRKNLDEFFSEFNIPKTPKLNAFIKGEKLHPQVKSQAESPEGKELIAKSGSTVNSHIDHCKNVIAELAEESVKVGANISLDFYPKTGEKVQIRVILQELSDGNYKIVIPLNKVVEGLNFNSLLHYCKNNRKDVLEMINSNTLSHVQMIGDNAQDAFGKSNIDISIADIEVFSLNFDGSLKQNKIRFNGPNTFHIGDVISNIAVKNIKHGDSGKYAIIGRSMGNETTNGLRNIYDELLNNRNLDIEIFDRSSLSENWKGNFDTALAEFARQTDNWTKRLSNQELMKLKMYQLNKDWAQKLVNEGYTVLDMGDFNNLGFSVFYAMEKNIIFN